MKLLMENWRGYLNEICDLSSDPYDFKLSWSDEEQVGYEFVSSDDLEAGLDYVVSFERGVAPPYKDLKYLWYINYTADGSHGRLTGEGQPLKIMSTVVAIIKDFIDNPKANQGIKRFRFTGITKGDETARNRSQRTKLYLRCLEKNLPDDFEYGIKGKNEISFGAKDKEEE